MPLSDLTRTWSPVEFTARGEKEAKPPHPAGETLLKGVLLRLPRSGGDGTHVKSFCLTCPHEICQVELTEKTQGVEVESGRMPEHPVFVCSCHFSAFNPLADGARIAGPSHRGLYRFKLEVRGKHVEVNEVERAALV